MLVLSQSARRALACVGQDLPSSRAEKPSVLFPVTLAWPGSQQAALELTLGVLFQIVGLWRRNLIIPGGSQSAQTSPGRWIDCRPHRNSLWSAKGTSSCLEGVFPPRVGASIPKLPPLTAQSRPAFDDRQEQAINIGSRSVRLNRAAFAVLQGSL